MSEESPDLSRFVEPGKPCPQELRSDAAFAIGYAVSEIRRHQIALWRSPSRRDAVLSDLAYSHDCLERALLLLSEELHGGVLVLFLRHQQKVLDDLTSMDKIVSNRPKGQFKLKGEALGELAWESLAALAKRLFVDEALSCRAKLGASVGDLIRTAKADDLAKNVASIRQAAIAADASLSTPELHWLLGHLDCYECEAERLETDLLTSLAAPIRLWSMAVLDRLYLREQSTPILSINFELRIVTLHNAELPFSDFQPMHLRILYALARYPSQTIAHRRLLAFIGSNADFFLHEAISRLRQELRPAICRYFACLNAPVPVTAKRGAYITALRSRRVGSTNRYEANPYRLNLAPNQVVIIGSPPPDFCHEIDLIGR